MVQCRSISILTSQSSFIEEARVVSPFLTRVLDTLHEKQSSVIEDVAVVSPVLSRMLVALVKDEPATT